MSPKSIKGGARPTPESLTLESQAQEVLDELWIEDLIPFQLHVGKLTDVSGEHIIHFHDSRIYTAHVPFAHGEPWKVMVRTAVLDRVAQLSRPLQN